MSDNGVKIGASNEMLGAMLSADAVLSELKADAKSYILSRYNVDLGDIEIALAENEHSVVHLTLPYYAGLEKSSMLAMADEDTSGVAGGEIGFLIGALVASGVVVGGTAILGAAIGTAVENK